MIPAWTPKQQYILKLRGVHWGVHWGLTGVSLGYHWGITGVSLDTQGFGRRLQRRILKMMRFYTQLARLK